MEKEDWGVIKVRRENLKWFLFSKHAQVIFRPEITRKEWGRTGLEIIQIKGLKRGEGQAGRNITNKNTRVNFAEFNEILFIVSLFDIVLLLLWLSGVMKIYVSCMNWISLNWNCNNIMLLEINCNFFTLLCKNLMRYDCESKGVGQSTKTYE